LAPFKKLSNFVVNKISIEASTKEISYFLVDLNDQWLILALTALLEVSKQAWCQMDSLVAHKPFDLE
jgi:hypothetical protein